MRKRILFPFGGGGGSTRFDDELHWHQPDYVISFLSPWIVPGTLLKAARVAAINFHPGSPQYPGTGCYNFALYEKAVKYGITCHHMKEKVDSGQIIMTSYFDVAPNETVETLKIKSMNHMLMCFCKVIAIIHQDLPLPSANEKWARAPFTRKQLDNLCYIDPMNTDIDDINLRIKATSYPGAPGAYTVIGGTKFVAESQRLRPIL